jgi:hypothetical protein
MGKGALASTQAVHLRRSSQSILNLPFRVIRNIELTNLIGKIDEITHENHQLSVMESRRFGSWNGMLYR